jgi:hypothetical protein
MIVRLAEIYERAARKNKISPELVASIGEHVFKELMNKMYAPDSLAYELDHVGTFAVRHKNFIGKFAKFVRDHPDSSFLKNFEKIPQLILDYRKAKFDFKLKRREYDKAKQQGQD